MKKLKSQRLEFHKVAKLMWKSRETQVSSSKENQNKKSKKLILLRSNVWDGGPKKLK